MLAYAGFRILSLDGVGHASDICLRYEMNDILKTVRILKELLGYTWQIYKRAINTRAT